MCSLKIFNTVHIFSIDAQAWPSTSGGHWWFIADGSWQIPPKGLIFLCVCFWPSEPLKHSIINNLVTRHPLWCSPLLRILYLQIMGHKDIKCWCHHFQVSEWEKKVLTFCVSLFRYALEERGLTCRRSVNAAPSHQSCMTGSTWASWPCYHWYYTGFSLSGTLERKGRAVHAS